MIGTLTLTADAEGKRWACLTKVAEDFKNEVMNGFLTETESLRITQIFEDASQTPQEQAKAAFEIVFEARLRSLSPEEQNRARSALESAITTNANFIKGRWVSDNPLPPLPYRANIWIEARERLLEKLRLRSPVETNRGQVQVTMPKNLQDGIVYYQILLHELEHSIQDQRLTSAALYRLRSYVEPLGKIKHLKESGAVGMEMEYLKSIPLEIRQALATELESMTKDNLIGPKLYLVHILQSSPEDFEGILLDNLALRHYSLDTLTEQAKNQRNQALKTNLPLAEKGLMAIGLAAVSADVLRTCRELHEKNKKDSDYYKIFCDRIFDN